MQKRTDNIRINKSDLQQTKIRKGLPPQPIISQSPRRIIGIADQSRRKVNITFDRPKINSISSGRINQT